MAPFFSHDDSELIHRLNKLSSDNPKLVKHNDYVAPALPDITVRSWKMNEFKYNDIPSPFPTLARGLFSTEVIENGKKLAGNNKKYRIVVRGYDKFFNIGEVPWTTWVSLEDQTSAPYTLSLKSNGCIIFIAALSSSKLLVTSKHSLGPVQNVPESHSDVGERWLQKHVQSVGKTLEHLAAILWENNWTAVAELCDDNFEEHVLPCPPEKSGLHLHGINETTKEFKTLPTEVVDKFAEDWGFIVTKTIVMNSIPEVRAFTDEIGKTGKWNGEPLEGFVVRTRVTESPADGARSARSSPYAPGSTFFFKVKFDEPYMMYRDWREVTKSLLAAKGPLDNAKLPKSKMTRPETKIYAEWTKREIKKDRKQFEGYTKGKGIIAIRERFLEWRMSNQGRNAEPEEITQETEQPNFGKTIIVPVAVPGVGKTAVAVALAHIFGFGHTQSDDVHVKKPAPIFVKNVVKLLNNHDVVIADKNNHLRQHRESLRAAVKLMKPPVRLLALNWSFDQPLSTIHRICGDRVLNRGENHQSLRGDTLAKSHQDIIWQFINDSQELAENEVDDTIEMELGESLEQAVDRAVDGCVRVLGLPNPDQEKVGEALAVARGYVPGSKRPDERQKTSKPRYYGLLAEVDLQEVLNSAFSMQDAPADGKIFWNKLTLHERVAKRPHVTIVHTKSLPKEQQLWDRSMNLHLLPNPPLFKFRLGHVVWNDRVMALTVEDVNVIPEQDGPNKEGEEFIINLPQEVANRLHITVGTRNKEIPPYEAGGLVESWKNRKKDQYVESMALSDAYGKGRVNGLFF